MVTEEIDLRYTKSDRTHPVIEYTSDANVREELQDLMNDFVFRVFFAPGSAVQQLLALKEDKASARALISKDVEDALTVLRTHYADIAPRLSASSVDAAFIGGSKFIVRVEITADDTGDSPVVISHSFNTTAGM